MNLLLSTGVLYFWGLEITLFGSELNFKKSFFMCKQLLKTVSNDLGWDF